MRPHRSLLTGLPALVLISCGSTLNLGNDHGRPSLRWQQVNIVPCAATVLLPQPIHSDALEPGQTDDGASVYTHKWRYEIAEATFLVTCERLDRGNWGPKWPRYAARGIFTQFQLISTDTTGAHQSPIHVGSYVGIGIEATSPSDGSRLLAHFLTRDTMALQLIARHPDDPQWRSAARTFLQSLRPDA